MRGAGQRNTNKDNKGRNLVLRPFSAECLFTYMCGMKRIMKMFKVIDES